MNYEELISDFLALEGDAGQLIESFVLPDGINVWPHLRIVMLRDLRFPEDRKYFTNNFNDKQNLYKSRFELPPDYYRQLTSIPRGSCLFFSRRSRYVEKVRGMLYDPYLDPVVQEADRLQLNPIKIVFTQEEFPAYISPLCLPRFEIGRESLPSASMPQIPGYNEYAVLALERRIPVLHWRNVLNFYLKCMSHAEFFEKILALTQPKAVILECYYSPEFMGLAQACRKFGIPSVDYQHGKQKPPHLAYSFKYMPKHGYDVLPEWFFAWGDVTAHNLRQCFAEQDFHKAAVAGKPAYISWKRGLLPEEQEQEQHFLKRIQGRIPLCVAFGARDGEMIKTLEAAIAMSPPEWLWLLRQHPLNPQPEVANLAQHWPERTETAHSSTLRLFTLLQHCRHMVTGVSSCAIEALSLFNMEATCMKRSALIVFADHITGGNMRYAPTPETVLESVKKGLANYPCSERGCAELTQDTTLLGNLLQNLMQDISMQHADIKTDMHIEHNP